MNYPRWYPTLTTLSDGRVLVFGGTVNQAGCAEIDEEPACLEEETCLWSNGDCLIDYDFLQDTVRTPEIYDPSDNEWDLLGPLAVADFDPPWYPFMFVLPDGNVFYAGGEGSDTEENLIEGRVLILDDGDYRWSPNIFEAPIGGGSAVMYGPGKIMKSGGTAAPTSRTVFIELDMEDDDEDGVLNYLEAGGGQPWLEVDGYDGDMLEPRHYHQLTLLPDGRVAATGGNWHGNSNQTDDSPFNSCTTNEVCDPAGPRDIVRILCDDDSDCPCEPV